MSAPKNISVNRNYQAAPEHCLRALELLLKKPVSEKAAQPGGPDPVRKDLDAHTATNPIISE